MAITILTPAEHKPTLVLSAPLSYSRLQRLLLVSLNPAHQRKVRRGFLAIALLIMIGLILGANVIPGVSEDAADVGLISMVVIFIVANIRINLRNRERVRLQHAASQSLRAMPFRLVACQLGKTKRNINLRTCEGSAQLQAYLAAPGRKVQTIRLQFSQPWHQEEQDLYSVVIDTKAIEILSGAVTNAEVVFPKAYYCSASPASPLWPDRLNVQWVLGGQAKIYLN